MSEYIVTRTTYYSGSSGESIAARSIADKLFTYAARKNYPLVYGLGGMVPDAKTGQMQNVQGAFRQAECMNRKHEWYTEDMVTFNVTGGSTATVIVSTTAGTSYDLHATGQYAKVRAGEILRCKESGDKFLILSKGTTPAITLKSLAGASKTIPANATFVINSRAVKEYSGAGTERDSIADNNYNLMQIIREDASISRSEEQEQTVKQGKDWDAKGRRRAKAAHLFMRYLDNALTLGIMCDTTDASSVPIATMGGIDNYTLYNIFGATAPACSSEFSSGHGGTISFDEFMEYTRVLSAQYDKGETVGLLGGSIWDMCFTKWMMKFPGAFMTMDSKTDEFGFAVKKIKTPFLNIQKIDSGTVEENCPDTGLFIDPKLIRVMVKQKPNFTEIDMMKTQQIDGTAMTWLAEMTLEMNGAKRFGKITGVTGVEV